jgi:alkanesulfonate monooxygenase SsuD/methylene tetrahydromethanopterin reductase-like flavin-dependent oxidoreductase (luciferase family)
VTRQSTAWFQAIRPPGVDDRASGMIDIGVGLWTMRNTAARPANACALYDRLARDATLAEELGFHSLWVAEHHFWYDGWCPATITAAAVVLGATTRLHAGTGIHLLSLSDPDHVWSGAEAAMRLSGGRLELGVGLGYRDEEFDGFGFSRLARGRRMDAALDALCGRWTSRGPPVMVGGFSEPALQRAAARGLGIFLPFSMEMAKLRATIEHFRELTLAAGQSMGRIGMLKYVWATNGSARERELAQSVIHASAREYTGSWFSLHGQPGFESSELLEAQLRRASDNALIGTSEEIAERVSELEEAGVDLVVLQVTRDDTHVAHRPNMETIGEHVLGALSVR